MKSYYVYILQCSDQYLYTGVTNNISRRILEHQQGLNISCYTYKRRPVELIFHQVFNDVNQAIYFEKKIKKWSRAKKLALGKADFDLLQILAECKNETTSKNYKLSPQTESRGEAKFNTNQLGLDSARPDKLDFNSQIETENQEVHLSILKDKNIQLFIKREDLIHPFVSGNKFRKLKYNIQEAQKQQKETLLTFGGAFSNHIAATAVAGKLAGIKTVGIIRGEELGIDLEKTLASNATLRTASQNGMQLHFVTRKEYRHKTAQIVIDSLKNQFGDFYLVPEGGTNELAVKGCEEILTKEDEKFDYICSAVGTGGTISGLINSTKEHQKVLGFPALKGDFLCQEIQPFIDKNKNWSLIHKYHFGGYAKYNSTLISFMNQFYEETQILLDPIYTGKMVFGILDLVKKNSFQSKSTIVAIHTGGLQGIEGINQKLANKNQELINVL